MANAIKRQGYILAAFLSLSDANDKIMTSSQTGTGTAKQAGSWEGFAAEIRKVCAMLVRDPNARKALAQAIDLTKGEIAGLVKKVGKLLVTADVLANTETYPQRVRNEVFTAVRRAFEQLQEAEKLND